MSKPRFGSIKRFRGYKPKFDCLEERQVLSGMGLVDGLSALEDPGHDEDYDCFGNELHALPMPSLEFSVADVTAPGTNESSAPIAADAPLSETFLLNSNPGAAHTIYLDFDGHTTSGTSWNNAFEGGNDFVTPEYDFSGDAGFSDAELQRIQYIWQRVAEDFAPFDVNVTTQDPGTDALIRSGSGDTAWGVRVVIGGDGTWYKSGVGGVAYLNSFNWSSDTPVYVFENNLGNGHEKYTAEAISHEAGHALGLSHDGNTSSAYYQGHGSGETGWAPIMGVGYYRNLTQWSQGEYSGANNLQDDLAIITGSNGFGYRADDHGDASGAATEITVTGDSVSGSGIIETNTDVDVFTFFSGTGQIDLSILPAARGANLDVLAELYDSFGELVASSNPLSSLSSQLSLAVDAGQYFLHVSGVGEGDPLSTGYSDYGSLGQYTISGSVVGVTGSDSLSIAAVTPQKVEGDSGTTEFSFQVTRSGDASTVSSVNWNVVGSGADASDFVGGVYPGSTLQFAEGETVKTITVSVQGDTDVEGNESFSVQLSGASTGTLLAASSASATILNDDVPPGVTVSPTSGLTTSENGNSASFSVVLDTQPTADVVITVTSLDTTEGTVDKSTLTFTPSNWDQAQVVTVTGVDDAEQDNQQTYMISLSVASSSDNSYDGLDVDDVTVTNDDNESKGKGNSGTKGGGGGGGGGGKGGGKGGGTKPGKGNANIEALGIMLASDLTSTDSNTEETEGWILVPNSATAEQGTHQTGGEDHAKWEEHRPDVVHELAVNRPTNEDLIEILATAHQRSSATGNPTASGPSSSDLLDQALFEILEGGL